jgi:hemolysin activation/secretion protein
VMTTPPIPASTSPDTLATAPPTPTPTPTPTPIVATPSAPPPRPVPSGTEIDGVEITWGDAADDTWGAAASLFDVTRVHLRQVDDSIQAGTDETTDALGVTNLGDMQGLRWRPSATRALLQAMEARLQDLGMARSSLSHEFTTTAGRRVLEVSLEVPPRDARMPANSTQREIDGTRVYPVWPFEVGYFSPHPDLPPVSVFMNLDVTLSSDGLMWSVAAENEANSMTVTLGQLNESGPMCFSPQAIQAINAQLGDVLIDDGLLGVRVAPASAQIVATGPQAGDDLRTGTGLQVGVDVGRVAEIRTLAAGDRISEDERVDHERHTDIASGSPLKAPNGDEEKHGDLLRQEQLDDYLYFLSRHPGRDVEASVASSQFVGGISLEYTVSEAKPWTAWFQYGNTGTKSEGYQRYRFGYYTTQATGNDDILSLQYVTSNLSDTNAVMGSYEAPIGLDGRLRAGVNGSWSQYFADQFGVFGPGSFFDDAFNGHSWSAGGELRWNAYQEGAFFMDVIGGMRLQHLSTSNNLAASLGIPGLPTADQASFLIPYGMLHADRAGEWSQFDATVGLEGNVLSHSQDTLEVVGLRANPANQWVRFNGQMSFSTYLEPLIDSDGWSDPSTPKTSTLAHELYGKVSGQYSFGNRLMPQFQEVVGGPGTNRGYPVYIVAGDDVLNVTGEYRFHLPRTFDPNSTPSKLLGEPFRMAPQYVYGRPDWDLVLLGFIDASWVGQTNARFEENGGTLVSTGVGLDLILKTNFRVRLDWGWALESLQNGLYDAGQNRLYVQASLYF